MFLEIIRDPNISLEAKGLWMQLSKMETGSEISESIIANNNKKDSRKTVRRTIQELVDSEYLTINTTKDNNVVIKKYIIHHESVNKC